MPRDPWGPSRLLDVPDAANTGEQLGWLYGLFTDHYHPSPEPDLELGLTDYPSQRSRQ